jgi:hypothetical protein
VAKRGARVSRRPPCGPCNPITATPFQQGPRPPTRARAPAPPLPPLFRALPPLGRVPPTRARRRGSAALPAPPRVVSFCVRATASWPPPPPPLRPPRPLSMRASCRTFPLRRASSRRTLATPATASESRHCARARHCARGQPRRLRSCAAPTRSMPRAATPCRSLRAP